MLDGCHISNDSLLHACVQGVLLRSTSITYKI
jgi:hypothetical protein